MEQETTGTALGSEGETGGRREKAAGPKTQPFVMPSAPTQAPSGYTPRYIPLWNNVISIAGMLLALLAVLLLVTFGLFTLVSRGTNPYVDIVGYLVLPGILIVGLAIVPFGIFFKSWRIRRRDPTQRLAYRLVPRVDLNDPAQRRVAKVAVGAVFVLLPIVGVSSYHGYHFTDSTEFCAKACHTVMEPQAVAYERSPHARVVCAECHIGEGAGWFVKSKLSGTRQVLAMWRDSFSRPIPPAISHLRPARETCEHCHWPQKFYGAQLKEIAHYAPDETNTLRQISMLLKIGGGDNATAHAEGIHWHMALASKVEYIATDDKLQVIPWIRTKDARGHDLIYRSDGRPSSDPPPEGQLRHLDCMDCHNRPAHKFLSPHQAVDAMLFAGRIDTTLPYIKREAVTCLTEAYPDVETAEREIGMALTAYYQENYAEVWATRRASVNQAVDVVREVYRSNFFPEMKVDWRTYPDNIGHLISPGCFRCHNDRHVNQAGAALSSRCDVCHTFLNHVSHGDDGVYLHQGAFKHPMELEGIHASLRCDQCHTGGLTPPPTCDGCHTAQSEFIAGASPLFEPFSIEADAMATAVDCETCHDVSAAIDLEAINEVCLDCHDDEEERFDGLVVSWKKEVERLLEEADGRADPADQNILDALRAAGPLHNMEATRAILSRLSGRSVVLTQPSTE